MDILDDMGVSKLSAKVFFLFYFFKSSKAMTFGNWTPDSV